MLQKMLMDIKNLLREYSRQVDDLLAWEMPPDTYQFISEGVWYQFSSGGKRLRPALCLLTCGQLGGDPGNALPFALAAEILHNFLLIHDDIEDGDTIRRDRKTLWAHLGIANAINIGDFLISNAYRIILTSPLPPESILRLLDIFSMTFQRTVEGQALDINLRGAESLTLQEYYRIVQLKTAYYLTFNLVGGAVAAGIDGQVIDQLWELGRCLGPAFQIRDDTIDMTDGKGRGGEIGCDIREGKPSIFYAYALERLPKADPRRRLLIEIACKPREATTPCDVETVIGFYRDLGAFQFAEEESKRLLDQAFGVIDRLPLESKGKDLFRAIGQFMIERQT